ncbi:MAG TPA: NAD(P)H-binding protein, partial [Anaerolineales bacterium]|nr:NAD(P)H-binding protein [Anaerolineales bacterium]
VLVTGATGFVGRAVLPQLTRSGHQVRILLRPSPMSPRLPAGVPVEVGLSSLTDARGLRAGLLGVEAVIHLAGGEGQGSRADLAQSDAEATRTLVEAAAESGVKRLVVLSHLGADRASAYPVLQAKGMAEEAVRRGGVAYTIIRSAAAYGPEDRFTTSLAMALAVSPGVIFLPAAGATPLQPLWIDDLATAIVWALEEDGLVGRTYEVGGPEVLTLRDVVGLVMTAAGLRRMILSVRPWLMRAWLRLGEVVWPKPSFTPLWVDYLAAGRTAPLDTLPRAFGLVPARMQDRLGYLRQRRWGRTWLRRQLGADDRHV